MSNFDRPLRKRKVSTMLDDFVIDGDEGRAIINAIKSSSPTSTCSSDDLANTLDKVNAAQNSLGDLDLQQALDDLLLTDLSSDSDDKKMRGGGMTGLSGTSLLLLLIADAIREGSIALTEQTLKLLAAGFKVLEFLANKDGCAEQILYHMLGSKVFLLFKTYLFTMLAASVDPIDTIAKLSQLIVSLLPYAIKGFGTSVITITGYILYNYAFHYGEKLSEEGRQKLSALKVILDDIETKTPEDFVRDTNAAAIAVKDAVLGLKQQYQDAKETADNKDLVDFVDQVGRNLTEIPPITVGEIKDAKTIEQLREHVLRAATTEGGKRKGRKLSRKKVSKRNRKGGNTKKVVRARGKGKGKGKGKSQKKR